MNLKPIGNNVLAKYTVSSDSINGILIPESSRSKSDSLEVIEASLECDYILKEGDKIIIDKHTGREIIYHDREYVIVNAKNIIALVVV